MLKDHIRELVHQVSVMSEEQRRREEQDEPTALRRKYELELVNLKVEALLVRSCRSSSVMPCVPLWHTQKPLLPPPPPPLFPSPLCAPNPAHTPVARPFPCLHEN
ncbi:hypothetical protein WMY93_009039 [Mugilogobius chulae]|uniref:Uncharacterized protein n=1 Tax=Mugilogobius chulae TaxID=88201 RepID=A0AAW0PFJ1_9GOBI